MELKNYLYNLVLSPKSNDPDGRRQEFILNIMLVSMLIGSLCVFTTSTILALTSVNAQSDDSYVSTLALTTLAGLILIVSRLGHFKIGSLIFIGFLVLATAHSLVAWGYMLQVVVLLEILIIFVAGIMFSALWGLFVSATIAVLTIILGIVHQANSANSNLSWQSSPYMISDAIGFSVIFLIIGLLTWLSNREISYSLSRAKASELALKIERDNLEVKIINRTKELENTQVTRLMELQKFAEFGRLNANLLHEIANPLTSAKLYLELAGKAKTNPIIQVSNNLKQMERYLVAARHQINGTGAVSTFLIDSEIKQIIQMLKAQTDMAGVIIDYLGCSGLKFHGDAVKFSQIVRNLLSNSIDSYVQSSVYTSDKRIIISVEKTRNAIVISVQDFGQGLTLEQIGHIFEPFYTTKGLAGRNLGLGLAMVKRFVEQDFKGRITVTSSKVKGTVFRVSIKI